jgi:adenylylsulfate kinase
MSTRILVCGLPTSGKTTFSRKFAKQLANGDDTMVLVLNGDDVRKEYNDWDFSHEGRVRQAQRMYDLSTTITTSYTIIDFVCPLEEMRKMVKPDWIIWMDTIDEGPYENTNRIFEEPTQYDFRITSKSADFYQAEIKVICDYIRLNHRRPSFDSSKPTVQMLGRWQPWHAGHQALFERALQKNRPSSHHGPKYAI